MLFKKILLSFCLSFMVLLAFSQKYNVSGFVKDVKTDEPIIGAVVYELHTSDNGTSTNPEGFYSLSFEKKRAKIKFAYIGYEDTVLALSFKKDTLITVYLKSLTDIEEVEIEDDEIKLITYMDSIKGDIRQVNTEVVDKNVPIKKKDFINPFLSNEIEPGSLKEIYTKYGNGNNQDLIFIDKSRVYNSSQSYDFKPFIQDNALHSFDHSVGNFPARYGEFLSSVLDIKIKEGNMKRYSGSFYFDLFNLGFYAEGPVIKEKSSLFVAARLSWLNNPYTELFMGDFSQSNEYWAATGFYDLNLKYTHKLSDNDKVYFSIFRNSNSLKTGITEEYEDSIIYSIGRNIKSSNVNTLISLNLEHVFTPDFIGNISLNLSQYNLIQEISGDSIGLFTNERSVINRYDALYKSGNEDVTLNLNFNYLGITDHLIKFGGYFTNHHIRPIKAELRITDFENGFNIDTTWQETPVNAQEYVLFAEDYFNINERLFINGGIHFSAFNSGNKTFYSVQPRIFAEFKIFKTLSVHASYAHYKQYIHFLANNSVGLSSDVFIPSSSDVLPQTTHYFVGGATLNLPFDIHIKAEAFYKKMNHVIEYKYGFGYFDSPGTEDLTGTNLSERIAFGESNLYGIRVLFNKDLKNFKFKIGHTISNSDRQFSDINLGENFQYRYNRRHEFEFRMNYLINENFKFYVDWIYRTGNYVTVSKQSYLPYNSDAGELGTVEPNITSYDWNNEPIDNTGNINDFQLPAYHRLDIGAEYLLNNHTFGIKIYNLYNHKNNDFVDYKKSSLSNAPSDQLVKYTIMPFFPTITYSYKF